MLKKSDMNIILANAGKRISSYDMEQFEKGRAEIDKYFSVIQKGMGDSLKDTKFLYSTGKVEGVFTKKFKFAILFSADTFYYFESKYGVEKLVIKYSDIAKVSGRSVTLTVTLKDGTKVKTSSYQAVKIAILLDELFKYIHKGEDVAPDPVESKKKTVKANVKPSVKKSKSETKEKAEAEHNAKEAKAKADAERKAKEAEAKAKAEAERKAKAEAEHKAKEAEAKVKADAERKAKEAEVKAKAEAERKAKAEVERKTKETEVVETIKNDSKSEFCPVCKVPRNKSDVCKVCGYLFHANSVIQEKIEDKTKPATTTATKTRTSTEEKTHNTHAIAGKAISTDFSDLIQEYNGLAFVNMKGLSIEQDSGIRKAVRKCGGRLSIYNASYVAQEILDSNYAYMNDCVGVYNAIIYFSDDSLLDYLKQLSVDAPEQVGKICLGGEDIDISMYTAKTEISTFYKELRLYGYLGERLEIQDAVKKVANVGVSGAYKILKSIDDTYGALINSYENESDYSRDYALIEAAGGVLTKISEAEKARIAEEKEKRRLLKNADKFKAAQAQVKEILDKGEKTVSSTTDEDSEKILKQAKEAYSAKEYNESMTLFKKAASMGNSSAMYSIGTAYLVGVYEENNPALAVAWYEEGTKRGNFECQIGYANAMWMGNVIPKNQEEAARLMKQYADNGNPGACCWMGRLYIEDSNPLICSIISRKIALEYLKISAEAGNSNAIDILNKLQAAKEAEKQAEKEREAKKRRIQKLYVLFPGKEIPEELWYGYACLREAWEYYMKAAIKIAFPNPDFQWVSAEEIAAQKAFEKMDLPIVYAIENKINPISVIPFYNELSRDYLREIKKAVEFFSNFLKKNPDDAYARFGLLLAKLGIPDLEHLPNALGYPIDMPEYDLVLKCRDKEIVKYIKEYTGLFGAKKWKAPLLKHKEVILERLSAAKNSLKESKHYNMHDEIAYDNERIAWINSVLSQMKSLK